MRTGEALAIVGIVAAAGGGLGAADQFNVQAKARALAITAETCALTYDKPSTDQDDGGLGGGYNGLGQPAAYVTGADASSPLGLGMVVTHDTLRCLRDGAYMPGGAVVDTSSMEAGEPEELLHGYVELEEKDAEKFDASLTLFGAIAGGGLGAYIAYRINRKRQNRDDEEESEEQPEDELEVPAWVPENS